ncbi:MAG TPA: SURF1 family protein [Halioglobus sp.]
MSGLRPRLNFEPEWRFTFLTVVLVPLLVGLGFWQLQRAEDKANLAAAFEERQRQPPAPLAVLWDQPTQSLAYAPVHLRGSFLPDQYFLLDNQVQHGKVGYEVLGILLLSDGTGSVLVNRGWIAGDAARRLLPEVPIVEGPVAITGYVYVAPDSPYLLAEQQLETGWPKRIQAVEMNKLAPAVVALQGGQVFPFPIRMNTGQPGALAVNWQVVNMSPQKHRGYAVQWFAMATLLTVFYLLYSSNLWPLMTGSGKAGK